MLERQKAASGVLQDGTWRMAKVPRNVQRIANLAIHTRGPAGQYARASEWHEVTKGRGNIGGPTAWRGMALCDETMLV